MHAHTPSAIQRLDPAGRYPPARRHHDRSSTPAAPATARSTSSARLNRQPLPHPGVRADQHRRTAAWWAMRSESDVDDMLPDKTAAAIRANRDIVVGIKSAHFRQARLRLARPRRGGGQAGRRSGHGGHGHPVAQRPDHQGQARPAPARRHRHPHVQRPAVGTGRPLPRPRFSPGRWRPASAASSSTWATAAAASCGRWPRRRPRRSFWPDIDLDRPPRVEHHGHEVRHAELHFEDDGRSAWSSRTRSVRSTVAPAKWIRQVSRTRHARRGHGRGHRHPEEARGRRSPTSTPG
jgi:hypothetical protein